ncbi:MAG: hypothetical protein LH461_09585, partial [Spirochaetaceae bacterium]|nr:hypothetical protein [Spirochaetaceae bacterium]
MSTSRPMLFAGAAATAALLTLSTAAPALAAGEVVVTDRETVQVYMTPTGEVKVARVYDQVTATGKGTVDIANPVGTDDLRNLEGLSGLDVKDGNAVAELTVDGEERLRTVSTFDGELPVTIKPTYSLDGKVYDDPEDLVGRSGELSVKYRVENITGEPTTLTFKDGNGNDVERLVNVPMPLAGQLVTVLPKDFYSVRSDQATISADGRGGTRMTFTMTLLPPVGNAVAEIGYTAQVSDAVIPRATVTIAVVQPLKNPSLSTAAAAYQGGAASGATLTAGATEIDANLLKLRDGAGQLLGGLLQLRDGAMELNAGLAGKAAPGANKLADGAGKAAVGASALAAGLKRAKSGSDRLAGGLGKLADGNGKLAAGFNSPTGDPDLVTGSQDLASGLGLISGGLATLSGVEGLPAAQAGLIKLKTAVDTLIIPAIGTTSSPCDPVDRTKQTLLGCLQPILGGLTQLGTSHSQVSSQAGVPTIQDAVRLVLNGINKNPSAMAPADQPGLRRALQLLEGGLRAKTATGADLDNARDLIVAACGANAVCVGTTNAVFAGLKTDVNSAADSVGTISAGVGAATDVPTGNPATTTLTGALNGVNGGLSAIITAINNQLVPGVTGVRNGLVALRTGLTNADLNAGRSNPVCSSTTATGSAGYCGLTEGLAQLVAGLTGAVSG